MDERTIPIATSTHAAFVLPGPNPAEGGIPRTTIGSMIKGRCT